MADLHAGEIYWRDLYPWLQTCGYELRPRYRPGWIPSWVTSPCRTPMEEWDREDHITIYVGTFSSFFVPPVTSMSKNSNLIDVIRIRDGKPFMLKKMAKAGTEKDIALYLSIPPPSEDPRNHCFPVEEVLNPPGDEEREIIVMPLLRPFDSPRFDTIGECVDFFIQAFEGLQFIHSRHVAHRDCTSPNLLMDASEMFPQGFHPVQYKKNREFNGPAKHYTRIQRPPRYYWIDYGLSIRYDESEQSPRAICLHGTDRTVPEFQDEGHETRPYDPFPTDIYYLGNLVRTYFLEGHEYYGARLGLEFMKPLIDDMVQDDPSLRPNINECMIRLEQTVGSLSSWKLRSQIRHSTDNAFGYMYRLLPHWVRRISYIIRRIPPIPVRKNEPQY